ncbi:hypothetical protein F503_04026 [Ophiostoma piceae UAMH 11346]|uniref:EamA domain-containing protein n=1 Tax=Ophiostoma piceae (strain UAMH 11346) TaxID=1262450 RepID=S3BQN2_OPHP1|nr:hypothetical protein F503_04026 [Ophiostoma piceae UAMH 11346]
MPIDNRSGTPLLYGQAAPLSPSINFDRGRSGHRTPRRLSDEDASHEAPLLAGARLAAPARPPNARQSSFRSRSPAENARAAARKRYMYASIFLVLSLVSFTLQTELAAWVQHAGWNKAYCMLYVTHGSWSLLWPCQLLIIRIQKRGLPWPSFWRRHLWLVRTTAAMVESRDLDVVALPSHRVVDTDAMPSFASLFGIFGPSTGYMVRATSFITCSLTVAGLSWYIAVSMTSPSDLTAIYNCSAFFAYAFSVPLLKEKLRLDKSFAVLVAVAGVLVVAYGDAAADDGQGGEEGSSPSGGQRLLGNLIIGVGSVLYGLYEVLYKRYACPPDGCSPGRGMIFANTFGSCIGLFTLAVLWVPLPLLHVTGIEPFVMPTGRVAWYLFLSVVMNATFAGSFLVLISLTSPVLSSVASLLTIFIVAVSDWWLTGVPPSSAALAGGSMIVVAFALLSWSTYKEMAEEEEHKKVVDISSGDDSDDE